MPDHVLITGGAGFIGSHLADELLRAGHRVRALDCLAPQVHGPDRRRPAHLDPAVELVIGDVRDREAVRRALKGVDAVVHLAAAVGVGQSMYRIERYTSVNTVGTAVLVESLAEQPVRKLVVASSASVYGEGLYRRQSGELVAPPGRPVEQLRRGAWDICAADGEALVPLPTPEETTPALESIDALSKHDQERLCLIAGRAYGIPAVALRLSSVYGPRQALSNPYAGVIAIFAARLLNDRSPLLFEDGLQQRDFVDVRDVARAFVKALAEDAAVGRVINVGSGQPRSLRDVAEALAVALGKPWIGADITHRCRMGDVRHNLVDIREARRVLGHAPSVQLERGLDDLAGWIEGQTARDGAVRARAELEARGLSL